MVVIKVNNPQELVDNATTNGIGGFAGLIGLGPTLSSVVDDQLASQLREKLVEQGVNADVYVTNNPPAPGGGIDVAPIIMIGALGLVAYLLIR